MRLENIFSKFQKGQISWCSTLRSTKILRLGTKPGETTKLHWLKGRRVGWWWLRWHWWVFGPVALSWYLKPSFIHLTSRALAPHTSSSEAGPGSVVRSADSNGKDCKNIQINSTIIFNRPSLQRPFPPPGFEWNGQQGAFHWGPWSTCGWESLWGDVIWGLCYLFLIWGRLKKDPTCS